MKKKKRKMDRGELSSYDPDRARRAGNRADAMLEQMVSKKTGLDPFKKNRRN